MVDHRKENWNYVFSAVQTISDRLESLGFDEIMEADNV